MASAGGRGAASLTPSLTRPALALIGPGRAGTVLTRAWQRAGYPLVAVAARGPDSVARAHDLLGGEEPTTPEQAAEQAAVVLLGVADDDIAALTARLLRAGSLHAGQCLVHLSGRYGIGVLHAAQAIGVIPLALHPIMTFTGTSVDLGRLSGTPFGVTAPEQHRPIAETLVVEAGGQPVWIDEQARPAYHAALTVAANHTATLLRASAALLTESGVTDPAALLGPVVRASCDNALARGAPAMTGPVPRGDLTTLTEHLDTLSASPPVLAAYRAVALLTTEHAGDAGLLSPAAAHRIRALLTAPVGSPPADASP